MFAVLVLLIGCGSQRSVLIPATAVANLSTPSVAAPSPTPLAAPTATSVPPTPSAVVSPTPDATATANHAHASAMPPAPSAGPPNASSPTASQPGAPVVVVRIINFAFDPPLVTVPVGTTITWLNVEGYHTVLSDDFLLNSPILENPGDRYSYTFTEVGDYDYLCGIHPDMLGMVQVVP